MSAWERNVVGGCYLLCAYAACRAVLAVREGLRQRARTRRFVEAREG